MDAALREDVMGFSKVFCSWKKTLPRDRYQYEAGRILHASLEPHAFAEGVLDALRGIPEDGDDPRAFMVLALVDEHRRTAGAVWQTLLYLVCEPMLQKVRARYGRRGDEDIDQDVLCAFAEALASEAVDRRRPLLSLRLATEKAVRANRLRGRAAPGVSFDETEHGIVEPAAEPLPEEVLAAEVARALETCALVDPKAAGLLGTLSSGESLRDYVARVHASRDEEERRLLYARLVKKRARLVADLRAQLRGTVVANAA